MMILRFLNWQGIAGIAASLSLAILLVMQKGETRHWRKQSAAFEQRYDQSQAAFAQTVAAVRAAAKTARAADQANSIRVAAQQSAINQRSSNDFQARLAGARANAQRLRLGAEAATDPGAGGGASVPRLSASPGRPAQAAGQDRLFLDERQVATEQAIQLDELIKWIQSQAVVDPNVETVRQGRRGRARNRAGGHSR